MSFYRTNFFRMHLGSLVAIVLVGSACVGGDAATGPGVQTPTESTSGNPADVFISFARPLEKLALKDTVTVTAVVVDNRRNVIADPVISWELRDTELSPQLGLGSIVVTGPRTALLTLDVEKAVITIMVPWRAINHWLEANFVVTASRP